MITIHSSKTILLPSSLNVLAVNNVANLEVPASEIISARNEELAPFPRKKSLKPLRDSRRA